MVETGFKPVSTKQTMLDIRVTIEGQKVIIEGLRNLGPRVNSAVRRGLETIGKGVYAGAYDWLSGTGSLYIHRLSKAGKFRREKFFTTPGGGYPVPVRTGHLRRLLAWLKPGETKTTGGKSFTAFLNEAVIYDSADYADVIHEGRGSSAKYGRRPYLEDALKQFNQGAKIQEIMNEEIKKEIGDLT